MKKIIVLLLGIIISISTFSKTLEGVGTGITPEEAKKEALSDLSNQLEVTVKSHFTSGKTLNNGKSTSEMSSDISTLSEIKILGADFKVKKKWFKSEYKATAKLDESKIELYEKKANELKNKINSNYMQGLEVENLRLKKNYFQSALQNYDEFESYKNVAVILGSKKMFSLPYTKTEIKNKLQSVEKKLSSDSLYNGVNILYIKSTGNFNGSSKEYFDNTFNTLLASISKENNDKVAISNTNDSTVTTLVKVVLNTNNTTKKPPVYYDKKMITPENYVTNVSITVELYNKKRVENLLTLTTSGEGTDVNSPERAYEKAVKIAFSQMKDKLEEALIGK